MNFLYTAIVEAISEQCPIQNFQNNHFGTTISCSMQSMSIFRNHFVQMEDFRSRSYFEVVKTNLTREKMSFRFLLLA